MSKCHNFQTGDISGHKDYIIYVRKSLNRTQRNSTSLRISYKCILTLVRDILKFGKHLSGNFKGVLYLRTQFKAKL